MRNPFHIDTPEHAAWERIVTLRIAPGVSEHMLEEILAEAHFAMRPGIAKEVATGMQRLAEQKLAGLADLLDETRSNIEKLLPDMESIADVEQWLKVVSL